MAAAFIEVDPNKATRILQALRAIREARALLGYEVAAAVQKVDGDTVTVSHFALFASKLGFIANGYADANTAAKAGYDELASLYAKLTAPSGQGDSTGAAIDQACAKFGV